MQQLQPRAHDPELEFWQPFVGLAHWPGADILRALVAKFFAGIKFADPDSFARAAGTPCLFLANHQVFVETMVFIGTVSPLVGRPIAALAKSEHRDRWPGHLLDVCFGYPGITDPGLIQYFDREMPRVDDVVALVEQQLQARGRSMLVHVEGTRRRSARRGNVQRLSPLWTELAFRNGWNVVPVRFAGGLPVEDPGHRQEMPVGFGRQTIHIGRTISAGELGGLDAVDRMNLVRRMINELVDQATEEPSPPDREFTRDVEEWSGLTGVDLPTASILRATVGPFGAVAPGPQATVQSFDDPLVAIAAAARALRRDRQAPVLEVPASAEGQWGARLARFLFGPNGLTIHEGTATRLRLRPMALLEEGQ